MSNNETDTRKHLSRRPLWASLAALGFAVLAPIVNKFTKWISDADSLQLAVGLMSAALITYIIAEVDRERKYEANTLEALRYLQDIRTSMSPFRVVSAEERYQLGTEIARAAKARVVLLAPSLILLTGPRPYGEQPVGHEKEQSDVLDNLAERASKGIVPEFRCAYASANVKQVITENGPEKGSKLREYVIKSLEKLNKMAGQNGGRFELRHFQDMRENMNYVFIVGDDAFAIWLRNAVNKGHDICITGKDKKIADNLVYLFGELTKPVIAKEEIKLLRSADTVAPRLDALV